MALTLAADERAELERHCGVARPARKTPARPGDSDAGRRRVVYHDHRDCGMLPGLRQPLEAAVRRGTAGWAARDASWKTGARADAGRNGSARILAKTWRRPPDGSTHWTTRKLAKVLVISHVLAARA
jgi:hypothetical protein